MRVLKVKLRLWLRIEPRMVAEVRPGLRVLKEIEGSRIVSIKQIGCRGSTRLEGTESYPQEWDRFLTSALQRFDPA